MHFHVAMLAAILALVGVEAAAIAPRWETTRTIGDKNYGCIACNGDLVGVLCCVEIDL
jgi:hypothetical protein